MPIAESSSSLSPDAKVFVPRNEISQNSALNSSEIQNQQADTNRRGASDSGAIPKRRNQDQKYFQDNRRPRNGNTNNYRGEQEVSNEVSNRNNRAPRHAGNGFRNSQRVDLPEVMNENQAVNKENGRRRQRNRENGYRNFRREEVVNEEQPNDYRRYQNRPSNDFRNYRREEVVSEVSNENQEESERNKKFFRNNYSSSHPPRNNGNRNRKPNSQRSSNKKPESQISQRERLIKEIETNTLECMICCEKIKSFAATFSCSNCHHILHLNCIKTWAKNSKNDEGEWRCPACNQVSKQRLSEYFCFCGKMKNPTPNRNDLPHSCGDMCLNTSNCAHPCQLRCHPGPHETCQAQVMVKCGCGKATKPYQCSMKATFECDDECDKMLNCGVHKCDKKCHQGACDDCSKMIELTCYCGVEKKEVSCTAENQFLSDYACEKECGKTLACGNHNCTEKCHKGSCKECLLLPKFIRSCSCGKKKIPESERQSCLDEIPTCTGNCSKPLRCGPLSNPHKCFSLCHNGECPPCAQTSKVKCRCGRKEETILCKNLLNSDIRCKKKCLKYKNCGNHKCNVECCIEVEHICPQNCNKLLNCKKHRCQRSCHIGNCAPCHRASFEELRCECGVTVIYPPVPCGTSIKECTNKCQRKHKCEHPVVHNCHSETNCPPCVFLTKKFCYGKHDSLNTIPCNQESFSCGMPCKKPLKCVRHFCIKSCHQGICEKPTDICTQKCTVKRTECGHNCNAKCHDGECPDVSCKEKVEVTCICANLKATRTCEQVEYENRKLQRVQMTMQGDENATNLKDLIGDFKKTTKILECNNDCKTLERNRRLEIGFKLINPSLATLPKFVPNYTPHVRGFYKKDSAFVNMVHDKLTNLVKLAKESKAPYRSFSFPSMNRDKRHVIHDMAEQFGVETKAYDAEPNRNIVATAVRESCWLPSMSISECVMRESGLRLPPTSL